MGTDKMSGEVSRSRQKKAAAPPAKKAQNVTNGGSTSSKSSNWNKENKKKSKDRKNKQNMASPKKIIPEWIFVFNVDPGHFINIDRHFCRFLPSVPGESSGCLRCFATSGHCLF